MLVGEADAPIPKRSLQGLDAEEVPQ